MFPAFLGQFRPAMKKEEPGETEKPPEVQRSTDSEAFVTSAKAKTFVKKWSQKKRDGKPIYTKRGITALLKALFQNPALETDKDILDSGDELLSMLGGMDGLSGFLMGWKAKSEGLVKAIKSVVGGE